jgi:monoterpene epsilon-lactone hydrolase
MAEIDAIRALLGSKPRPVGWIERRQRLDEVGSIWPVQTTSGWSPFISTA